ncbi:lipase family protein [Streptomyces sp. NPDC002659]|uniref:lipase family protein n=1 Tax=Streptomyces sp. NPDC002659 TaxID=3364656 RepID=UPI0036C31D36
MTAFEHGHQTLRALDRRTRRPASPSAVERGWSVIVPDYEGPASEFLGAAAAAHGILDGIRAARSFARPRR